MNFLEKLERAGEIFRLLLESVSLATLGQVVCVLRDEYDVEQKRCLSSVDFHASAPVSAKTQGVWWVFGAQNSCTVVGFTRAGQWVRLELNFGGMEFPSRGWDAPVISSYWGLKKYDCALISPRDLTPGVQEMVYSDLLARLKGWEDKAADQYFARLSARQQFERE